MFFSRFVSLYFKSLVNYETGSRLEKQTLHFANLANFVALKGGALKSEQFLSADMADIFSNLYLAHSVLWYHEQFNVSKKLTDYCVERLCSENQIIMNRVIDSLGPMKFLLCLSKKKITTMSYNSHKEIIDEMEKNNKINYHHLQVFSIKERFNGDVTHSEKRIKELTKIGKSLRKTLSAAEKKGYQIEIHCPIEIKVIK